MAELSAELVEKAKAELAQVPGDLVAMGVQRDRQYVVHDRAAKKRRRKMATASRNRNRRKR